MEETFFDGIAAGKLMSLVWSGAVIFKHVLAACAWKNQSDSSVSVTVVMCILACFSHDVFLHYRNGNLCLPEGNEVYLFKYSEHAERN